jgi:hypothetical protein
VSHFTVLVIGDKPEEKLAPYQENNEGTCLEEYLEFYDVEEEQRKNWETETTKSYYAKSFHPSELKLSDAQLNELNAVWETIIPELPVPLFETVDSGLPEEEDEESPIKLVGGGIRKGIIRSVMIYRNLPDVREALFKYDDEWVARYNKYNEDADKISAAYDLYFEIVDFELAITEKLRADGYGTYKERSLKNVKIKVVPAPYNIPLKEKYPDFTEYIEDYCGYDRNKETGKYGYWHNPNSKWDWYSLGGRWSGSFKLKTSKILELAEAAGSPVLGNPGVFDNKPYFDADIAEKGDIDWDAMVLPENVKQAENFWDYYVMEKEPQTDEEKIAALKIKENSSFSYKRKYYLEEYQTKENYVKAQTAFSTFAVITEDGAWHEAGEMGWWGMDSAEIGAKRDFRIGFFEKFIKDLPDTTLLSVFDCHI